MEQRMRQLVDMLNKYAHAYYVLDDPQISDGQYDVHYDELLTLEKTTGIVLPDSPTNRVGGEPLSAFVPHTHLSRLWSLDKCKTLDELLAWEARTKKLLAQQDAQMPTYLLEYKIDGLTVNLTYDNGKLVQAATRGNGIVGESILPQVRTIRSIPLNIPFMGRFEVQGEAYMPISSFESYNAQTEEPLKNARNAAAGALRNLDPRQTEKRKLDAFFYQIGYIEGLTFDTAQQMRAFLHENGFRVARLLGTFTDASEAFSKAMSLDQKRKGEDFMTDGMVLKIDEMPLRLLAGFTDRFPRWAIAIKFEAEEAVTTLLDVLWDVGRTGKLTPTAILEPVELAGATVSRATLNNTGDIARKKVKLGGSVWIRRSNDVIPEILGSADDAGTDIPVPSVCPFCASTLLTRGANLFCPNQKTCKPQRLYALSHFVSREAMDIEGLSEKTLAQAMDSLHIITADQLYDITKDQWLSLEGFAQRRAEKLYDAVQQSKSRPLANFLYALGIPNVGKKTAQTLSETYGSIGALEQASEEDLMNMKDVGPIVAMSIVAFFGDDEQKNILQRFTDHGIDPRASVKTSEAVGKLAAEKIVFTGTLVHMGRKEAQELVQGLGAESMDNVTKETTLLIAGEKAGSKLEKARKLGIRILSEDEFFAWLGSEGLL